MNSSNFKKYLPRVSWAVLIAIVIGTFQFLAVVDVRFTIASVLVSLWVAPSAVSVPILSTDKEGGFVAAMMSLILPATFLVTTPAIIVAWAFRLREGAAYPSVVIDAVLLAILLLITTVAGVSASLARKDMTRIVYSDEPNLD